MYYYAAHNRPGQATQKPWLSIIQIIFASIALVASIFILCMDESYLITTSDTGIMPDLSLVEEEITDNSRIQLDTISNMFVCTIVLSIALIASSFIFIMGRETLCGMSQMQWTAIILGCGSLAWIILSAMPNFDEGFLTEEVELEVQEGMPQPNFTLKIQAGWLPILTSLGCLGLSISLFLLSRTQGSYKMALMAAGAVALLIAGGIVEQYADEPFMNIVDGSESWADWQVEYEEARIDNIQEQFREYTFDELREYFDGSPNERDNTGALARAEELVMTKDVVVPDLQTIFEEFEDESEVQKIVLDRIIQIHDTYSLLELEALEGWEGGVAKSTSTLIEKIRGLDLAGLEEFIENSSGTGQFYETVDGNSVDGNSLPRAYKDIAETRFEQILSEYSVNEIEMWLANKDIVSPDLQLIYEKFGHEPEMQNMVVERIEQIHRPYSMLELEKFEGWEGDPVSLKIQGQIREMTLPELEDFIEKSSGTACIEIVDGETTYKKIGENRMEQILREKSLIELELYEPAGVGIEKKSEIIDEVFDNIEFPDLTILDEYISHESAGSKLDVLKERVENAIDELLPNTPAELDSYILSKEADITIFSVEKAFEKLQEIIDGYEMVELDEFIGSNDADTTILSVEKAVQKVQEIIDRYGLTELDELIESKSVDTTIFSVETAVQKVQAIIEGYGLVELDEYIMLKETDVTVFSVEKATQKVQGIIDGYDLAELDALIDEGGYRCYDKTVDRTRYSIDTAAQKVEETINGYDLIQLEEHRDLSHNSVWKKERIGDKYESWRFQSFSYWKSNDNLVEIVLRGSLMENDAYLHNVDVSDGEAPDGYVEVAQNRVRTEFDNLDIKWNDWRAIDTYADENLKSQFSKELAIEKIDEIMHRKIYEGTRTNPGARFGLIDEFYEAAKDDSVQDFLETKMKDFLFDNYNKTGLEGEGIRDLAKLEEYAGNESFSHTTREVSKSQIRHILGEHSLTELDAFLSLDKHSPLDDDGFVVGEMETVVRELIQDGELAELDVYLANDRVNWSKFLVEDRISEILESSDIHQLENYFFRVEAQYRSEHTSELVENLILDGYIAYLKGNQSWANVEVDIDLSSPNSAKTNVDEQVAKSRIEQILGDYTLDELKEYFTEKISSDYNSPKTREVALSIAQASELGELGFLYLEMNNSGLSEPFTAAINDSNLITLDNFLTYHAECVEAKATFDSLMQEVDIAALNEYLQEDNASHEGKVNAGSRVLQLLEDAHDRWDAEYFRDFLSLEPPPSDEHARIATEKLGTVSNSGELGLLYQKMKNGEPEFREQFTAALDDSNLITLDNFLTHHADCVQAKEKFNSLIQEGDIAALNEYLQDDNASQEGKVDAGSRVLQLLGDAHDRWDLVYLRDFLSLEPQPSDEHALAIADKLKTLAEDITEDLRTTIEAEKLEQLREMTVFSEDAYPTDRYEILTQIDRANSVIKDTRMEDHDLAELTKYIMAVHGKADLLHHQSGSVWNLDKLIMRHLAGLGSWSKDTHSEYHSILSEHMFGEIDTFMESVWSAAGAEPNLVSGVQSEMRLDDPPISPYVLRHMRYVVEQVIEDSDLTTLDSYLRNGTLEWSQSLAETRIQSLLESFDLQTLEDYVVTDTKSEQGSKLAERLIFKKYTRYMTHTADEGFVLIWDGDLMSHDIDTNVQDATNRMDEILRSYTSEEVEEMLQKTVTDGSFYAEELRANWAQNVMSNFMDTQELYHTYLESCQKSYMYEYWGPGFQVFERQILNFFEANPPEGLFKERAVEVLKSFLDDAEASNWDGPIVDRAKEFWETFDASRRRLFCRERAARNRMMKLLALTKQTK